MSTTESQGASPASGRRSPCPNANTLDLAGDKWTLVVGRDLLAGRRTYGELRNSPEGIPTDILAERLRRLESAGLVERRPYQQRTLRHAYRLTAKGSELGRVLRAMVAWGERYVPGADARIALRRTIRAEMCLDDRCGPVIGASAVANTPGEQCQVTCTSRGTPR